MMSLIGAALLTIAFSTCKDEKCHTLLIEPDERLVEGSLVIQDNGIIGTIESVKPFKGGEKAKFCVPSGLRIPDDSRAYVGFLKPLATYGICIVSGQSNKNLVDGAVLNAVRMDSIPLTFPVSDTTLRDKAIEILKDLNSQRRIKNKEQQ